MRKRSIQSFNSIQFKSIQLALPRIVFIRALSAENRERERKRKPVVVVVFVGADAVSE